MATQRRRVRVGAIADLTAPTTATPATASATVPSQALRAPSPFERDQRRLPRSAELVQAVRNLDMTQDAAYRAELIDWIEAAYAERMGGVLLGLFARCYLGAPYVDHRLTIVGRILEHYSAGDEVPAPFDGARGLARSSVYSYIEIYSDGEIVPVTADGTPA